jgi:hypothetical protein
LIPISNAGLGLNKDQVSDRMIQFTQSLTLRMLEFAFILRTLTAETRQPWRSLKLTISYGDTDSIVISHTGLEDVSLVDL